MAGPSASFSPCGDPSLTTFALGARRELFGEKALALKHGKLALAVEKGRVVTADKT